MNHRAAVAFAFTLALAGLGAARAEEPSRKAGQDSDSDRFYQKGLKQYADGDPSKALTTFQKGLRLDPRNRSSLAAVRRLESELAPRPIRPSAGDGVYRPPPAPLERFLLVTIPRWFHFDRTIGDSMSAVGALEALNARIGQLMGERTFALSHNRRFLNDRRLRELLRRAPLVGRDCDEM